MSQTEYIARISHGKDSLKMLDVVITRGLQLDRITTTDVWATDTIRADFPEMVEFKERADEYIWRKYRIEVEHLCAMKDGEKLTYEKMFYHIPQRKADAGGVLQSSKEQSWASRRSGGRGVNPISKYEGKPYGFPLQRGPWCQKLKHIWVPSLYQPKGTVVPEAQDQVFRWPLREGQHKYRGIYRHRSGRTETLWAANRKKARAACRVRDRGGIMRPALQVREHTWAVV